MCYCYCSSRARDPLHCHLLALDKSGGKFNYRKHLSHTDLLLLPTVSPISRAARNYLLRDSEVRIDKFFICFGKLHFSRPGRTLGSQTRYLTLRVLFGRFLLEIPPDVTNILYFHFILYRTDFHI